MKIKATFLADLLSPEFPIAESLMEPDVPCALVADE
jgi:hypothetical protein